MAQKMTKSKKILKGIIVCSLCVNVIGSSAFFTHADTISKQQNITVIKPQKNNDLKIVQSLVGEGEDEFMMYYYSYKGMTKEEFKNKGLHIAGSFSEDGVNWSAWQDLEMYAYNFGEFGNYGGYMRFAVVDYKMDNVFDYKDDLAKSDKTIALSDVLSYNVGRDYNDVAPSLMELTPSNQAVQKPGSYKVTAKFNDNLIKTGDLKIRTTFTNATGLKVEISNIKIENKTEEALLGGTRDVSFVTFDLKTDETYGTHLANYYFELEGAVGKDSGKAPMGFGLTTAFDQKVYCYNNSFDGNMLAEQKNEIKGFNINTFNFTPASETDSKIIVIKRKGDEKSVRRLYMSCKNDVEKFDTVSNISIGINFTDGFDKDAKYRAYRFVKQADGTYKAVKLQTEINEKGLRIFGENTLN